MPKSESLAENKFALLQVAMLSGLVLPSVTISVLLASGEPLVGWRFYGPQLHLGVLKGS